MAGPPKTMRRAVGVRGRRMRPVSSTVSPPCSGEPSAAHAAPRRSTGVEVDPQERQGRLGGRPGGGSGGRGGDDVADPVEEGARPADPLARAGGDGHVDDPGDGRRRGDPGVWRTRPARGGTEESDRAGRGVPETAAGAPKVVVAAAGRPGHRRRPWPPTRSIPVASRTSVGIRPPARRGFTSMTTGPLGPSRSSVWAGPNPSPSALDGGGGQRPGRPARRRGVAPGAEVGRGMGPRGGRGRPPRTRAGGRGAWR